MADPGEGGVALVQEWTAERLGTGPAGTLLDALAGRAPFDDFWTAAPDAGPPAFTPLSVRGYEDGAA